MTYELMEGLLMFSFYQNLALAGAAAFFYRRFPKRRLSVALLIAFFLLTALQAMTFYINNFSGSLVLGNYLRYLLRVPVFIQPVLLWFFVLSLVPGRPPASRLQALHFLPALLFFTAVQLRYLFGISGSALLETALGEPVRSAVEIAQILGYSAAAGLLLARRGGDIPYRKWLMAAVACGFLVGLAVLYGTLGLGRMEPGGLNPFVFAHLLQAVMVFVLSLAALAGFLKWEKTLNGGDKYAHSSLSDSEADALQRGIIRLMEEEQRYMDAGLKLDDLSRALDCSRFRLSQVLNERFGKSFYELVNEYRVEAARQKLRSEEHIRQSISEIAYASGFNSLATFNRSFKAICQKTPSEYRKAHLSIE